MKRFTVVWDEDVEAGFINRWIAGDERMRAILSEIANWVDKNLAEDPECKGQVRNDLNARILAVPLVDSPLRASVSYEVWPDDLRVHVIRLTLRSG
jgi:hypothetical protein